jgi:hypothetical protein
MLRRRFLMVTAARDIAGKLGIISARIDGVVHTQFAVH